MPYLVNGQLVTVDRVSEEELRLSQNRNGGESWMS